MINFKPNPKPEKKVKTKGYKPASDYTALKMQLDKVFSLYIRLLFSDAEGFATCCTCINSGHWKDLDCGHLIPRDNQSTRWKIDNCAPQCRECNRMKDGNEKKFIEYLEKRYGNGHYQRLLKDSHSIYKPTKFEIEERIIFYKNANNALMSGQ